MFLPILDLVATGANIKALRKMHNMTVQQLADMLGLESVQSIYKWERGQCCPTVDNLLMLGALFEVMLDDIVATRGEKRGEDSKESSPLHHFKASKVKPQVYFYELAKMA